VLGQNALGSPGDCIEARQQIIWIAALGTSMGFRSQTKLKFPCHSWSSDYLSGVIEIVSK
jgi:hypothetical protein